jgi:hypothetical protein
MKTATRAKRIIGRKASFGISVATVAPSAEPIKAGTAIENAIRKSGLIFLRYEAVALAVPRNDGSLFVPSSSAGGVLGIATKSAGSCIKPPPPATASTSPARVEAKKRKRITSIEISTT